LRLIEIVEWLIMVSWWKVCIRGWQDLDETTNRNA